MFRAHQPPQDLNAERGVLGGIIIQSDEILPQVADLLTPGDFYDHRHGQIFAAMLALYERNQPVDEISLTSRLTDEGQIEAVGGGAYLAEVAEIILGPAHVDHYAALVKEKARLREFIAAAIEAIEEVRGANGDSAEALERAESKIFAATQERHRGGPELVGDGLRGVLDDIQSEKAPGITTGITGLDQLTGGLRGGELIIVAGRPGMGKTALALQVAGHVALQGLPVVVFSLEMSKKQLHQRLLAHAARVPLHLIRSHRLERGDWDDLTRAAEVLVDLPLYLDDQAAIGTLQIRSRARRLAAKQGLGLVVVDYIGLVRGHKGRDSTREQEVASVSRDLKALAKELDCPVLALSQVNRAIEQRDKKEPRLSDLRESGAIEQDADAVLFVHRLGAYDSHSSDRSAQLLLRKQRNGPTGEISLTFVPEIAWFKEA